MHSSLRHVPISELADVNPPTGKGDLSPDSLVSFIPMADVSNGGEWVIRQARRLQEVERGYTAFQENDTLFAKITPCTENGKGAHAIGLVNGIGFGSTEFHVLRPKHPDSGRFLFHWSQSEALRRKAASVMIGSAGQQRVPVWFFDEFTVPSFSLIEQRRIAEILDTADEAIRQTERLVAKLKAVKAGLLHDLLTRGLDEGGRLRDPQAHPEQFKDSALGRIPQGWQVVSLVEHFSFPGGQVDPKQEPYRNWPLVAPDHIESGTGRLLGVQTAAEQNAISGKYMFELGDVLYSKIRPYLRKAVLADRVGLCSADMYPLRPGPTLVPRFLLALILGEDFSRFASSVSMRSGFPKINREEFGEYITSLPDYNEQQRIVTILDAHDARIRAEEAALAKLRQVKRGLMDDLLTGKVRVTFDGGIKA